jgi:hypothetical protein
VKLRRFSVLVNSAVDTTGAETTRAGNFVAEKPSHPASGESTVCEGKPMGSFSCALKCKLQPLGCLTLIGTEGGAPASRWTSTACRSRFMDTRCSIPDDHIDPRRSALFMARSVLGDILENAQC